MKMLFSTVVAGAILLSGSTALAAELPTYEIMGFPLTQHQLVAVNSANVQERSPSPILTLGGMPASPHQIAVLTPRQRMTEEQTTDKGERPASGPAVPTMGVPPCNP
jgi:hypothetical protein